MSDSHGRSAEERERARLEREERRAAQARGEKPPASARAPKLPRTARAPKSPRGRAAPPPLPDREASPGAGAPPPAPRPGPSVDRVRRLARQARERATGDKPAAPPPEPPPRGRGFRVFGGALLLGGIVLLWLLASLFQPFKGDGEGSVRVNIPTGSGVGEIADLLDERGVISNATFFEVRATIGGHRGDLKPGAYELKEDMSYGAAIEALTAGPPNDLISLVIPEGRSRTEVAQIVADAGLEGDYEQATRRSRDLSLRRYDARGADSLEGFLWPATYELKSGSSVRGLVRRQLEAFQQNFRQVSLRAARRKNLTAYDVLIIASMVEREAQLDEERPVIASVIYNRLSQGEPLGIDATVRFATENWTTPLTESELEIDSPYNTRTNAGLPPGPIGSPGLASIRAAARPADTDFLFYVVKPGTCGEHEFSTTLAEFERDAARYNAERARRGGQSPTDC